MILPLVGSQWWGWGVKTPCYIDLINTIKLILPYSIILLTSLIPCLKDRDFNVDFINDRILILNNVINEICIERKDCNYFNIHTMFTKLFYRDFPNNTTNMMVYICHIQA